MAWAEAYLHAKFHLDASNRLATIHQRRRQHRHRQDRQRSDSIGRTEPFYKRSPKNKLILSAHSLPKSFLRFVSSLVLSTSSYDHWTPNFVYSSWRSMPQTWTTIS